MTHRRHLWAEPPSGAWYCGACGCFAGGFRSLEPCSGARGTGLGVGAASRPHQHEWAEDEAGHVECILCGCPIHSIDATYACPKPPPEPAPPAPSPLDRAIAEDGWGRMDRRFKR